MTTPHGQREALVAERVSKRFGAVVALDNVSLTAAEGACVALVGESGSGKSTLLRCFNRLVTPDSGTVRANGENVATVNPVALRRRIGYVPQDGGLLPHWRVQRNVELVLRLNGDANAGTRARSALSLVGLDPEQFGERWPRELSGGQRQRVAIARALAAEPALLALDEPTTGVDATAQESLAQLLSGLQNELGVTILYVSHEFGAVEHVVSRLVLVRGRIVFDGDPAALPAIWHDPSHAH